MSLLYARALALTSNMLLVISTLENMIRPAFHCVGSLDR